MVISTFNSRKISILSISAILMVLLVHSYYIEAESFPIAQKIQLFTGASGLSGVAVPLFFFISGLLFFKSNNSVGDCINGIKRRIRTLVIPYLIWNLLFVGSYVLLSLFPGVSQYVNGDVLSHLDWKKPIESLSFLFVSPAGFHLWFLRDLIVYVALTPLLYVMILRFPWQTLIALFFLSGELPRFGMTYFAAGGIISIHYGLDRFGKLLSKPIVFLSAFVFLMKCVIVLTFKSINIVFYLYLQQVANMAGIVAVWGCYDFLFGKGDAHRIVSFILSASRYSFFIYLFHEPVFNILKKLSLRMVGLTDFSLILLYLINPIIMFFVALGVAKLLRRSLPGLYSLIVGGR